MTITIRERVISDIMAVEKSKGVSVNTQADFNWGLLLELEASCSSKTRRLAQTKNKAVQLLWHLQGSRDSSLLMSSHVEVGFNCASILLQHGSSRHAHSHRNLVSTSGCMFYYANEVNITTGYYCD